MEIDWLTVAAQIANFLILVLLLQRFLYRPIARVMEEREARVAERLAEARARSEEAARRSATLEEKLAEIAREREAALDRVREEAQVEGRRLHEAARAELAETRRRWREDLDRERRELGAGLRREMAAVVGGAVRRCLADLADEALEERMVTAFLGRIGRVDAADLELLCEEGEAVALVTSFPLGEEAQGRISGALRDRLGRPVRLEGAGSDDLVCGLELRGAGRRLGWSVGEYLEALEEGVRARLSAGAPAEPTDAA